MSEPFRPVAPIDPTNLRPLLFLDVAHEIMLSPGWSHRAVTVVMESHTGPGRFSFYGANHPGTIDAVHERRVDISTVNPAAMLTMAHRGVGVYDRPRDVATIAVMPHDDRLGFALADRLGFTSLDDIAAARYPLRVSVRGSIDAWSPGGTRSCGTSAASSSHRCRWSRWCATLRSPRWTSPCTPARPPSGSSTGSCDRETACGRRLDS
jgi:hypothetical protein